MPFRAVKSFIKEVRNTPKSPKTADQMRNIEVPMDAIYEFVESNQTSVNKIAIKPFRLGNDFPINGNVIKMGGVANIYLNYSSLNYCGKRFIATKELVHILLHGKGSSNITTDVSKLIEKLIYTDMNDFLAYPKNIQEDILANFGAMELLMPQGNFVDLMDIYYKTGSIREVAIACRVPVKAVEFRLSIHPELFN